jgi:hypothetical protein
MALHALVSDKTKLDQPFVKRTPRVIVVCTSRAQTSFAVDHKPCW